MHGGSVFARSDGPGRGTEIAIRLPLAETVAAAQPATAESALISRDILVIEDNPDSAQTLADVLAIQGHRVRVANDGRAGLALAAERTPDVILCDLGLPGMDGYQVAQAVRRDPAFARVQLVALTGYAQPEDRQRTSEAGFDAHVAKPPDLDELARLLRIGANRARA
jgi:CheY-like chemotaxis protein